MLSIQSWTSWTFHEVATKRSAAFDLPQYHLVTTMYIMTCYKLPAMSCMFSHPVNRPIHVASHRVRRAADCCPELSSQVVIAVKEAKVQRVMDFLEEPKVMSERDLAAQVCIARAT